MINVIDLFSGAGGLTFGFQKKIENNVFVSREDFNIRFANEFNSDAAEAFRQNYPKLDKSLKLSFTFRIIGPFCSFFMVNKP